MAKRWAWSIGRGVTWSQSGTIGLAVGSICCQWIGVYVIDDENGSRRKVDCYVVS
jgi:hypothetical protein